MGGHHAQIPYTINNQRSHDIREIIVGSRVTGKNFWLSFFSSAKMAIWKCCVKGLVLKKE
jgi:hypothetical protein